MKPLYLFTSVGIFILVGCEHHHTMPLQPVLTPVTVSQVPGKHPVGVIMGQSNALGAGMDGEFDAAPGVTTDMPRRGPGYSMAANLVSKLGPIKLLTCAVGGSSMERWSTYGDLYRSCVSHLGAHIGPDEYLAFIAFDQGEAEATLTYEYPWAEHFTSSMRDLRTHYPNVPIVYAQLGAHTTNAVDIPLWSYVQDQQASVMLPRCSMVSTEGLDVIGEHYTESGYAELGRRMAQAFLGIE